MPQSVGEQLLAIRKKLGLNQGEFAALLEINQAHLSRVENGKSEGSMRLIKYAHAVSKELIKNQNDSQIEEIEGSYGLGDENRYYTVSDARAYMERWFVAAEKNPNLAPHIMHVLKKNLPHSDIDH